MKKILDRFNIIEIILILGPFIDIATSISQRQFNMSISLGLIIRTAFLVFMVWYVLFKSKSKYKKLSIIYILSTIAFGILYTINIYINKGQENLFLETREIVKAFYFPICLVGILNYIDTNNYSTKRKLFFTIAIEYLVLLFIPAILNIGYESYAQDKIGTIGWYFSGNEISSLFGILFVFIVFSYDYFKSKILYVSSMVLCMFTIMQIGTKIPALVAIAAIVFFIVIKSLQYIFNKEKIEAKFIISSIAMICLFIILLIPSPVIKNFDIYSNYLIKTRETRMTTAQMKENNEIIQQKDSTKLTTEEIETIIHSGRMETKNEISKKFGEAETKDKIMGLGRLDINENSQNLIEIDYFDILYNYGYLGFLIYFAPITYIIVLILRKINFANIKELICNNSICCYGFAIIIAFGLCAIAGHTLVAPAVSIVVAMLLLQMYKEIE